MKKQISYKIVSLVFSVLVICFAIAFYAIAWDEPVAPPPGGDIPAPLNTGNITQYKSGALGVGGLFETDNETHLAILGGNVGIGTVTPSQKLEISGGHMLLGTGAYPHLLLRDTSFWLGVKTGSPFGLIDPFIINSNPARDIVFSDGATPTDTGITGGTANMVIKSNGNVGIGTPIPTQKLDVAGQIHATGDICTDLGGGGAEVCLSDAGGDRFAFGAWTNQDILGDTIQGNLGNLNTNQYQAAGDGFLIVRKHSGTYPRINIFVKLAGLGSFIELYDARQNTGGVSDQSATIPIGKDDIFYVNTDRVDGDFQIYWKPIGNFQLVKQGVSFPTAYVSIAVWRERAFITSDTAHARITVTQDIAAGPPLGGVTVHGTWSGDYRATVSGVTNVSGQVTFVSDWVARVRSVTFTVNRITVGGHEFTLAGGLSVTW